METHYDVLGVHPLAMPDEVRAAHRRLARRFHPDRHAIGNPAVVSLAHDVMARINAAWTELADDDRRAAYDRRMAGDRRDGRCHWPAATCSCGPGPLVTERRSVVGRRPR